MKLPKALSKGEETLALQLKVEGIRFEREFAFDPKRKWKIDFALPLHGKIAIEVEGFGHHKIKRYLEDIDKYNHVATAGWKLLRFTTHQVESGEAIQFIKKAIQ